MAQRYDSHYLQLLTNEELDAIGDGLEQADWDMVADHGLVGITLGGAVVEHSPTADLTVDVPSLTTYDSDGTRIRVPSTQRVDLSVDHNSVSTAVAVPGNEKVLSLFVFFERSLSEPRIDGNSVTVYWNRAESFAFKVVQGAESGVPATPPALEADKILLADIKRENPQTQIENDDITLPGGSWVPTGGNRRQDAFVLSSGSLDVREGTAEESDQALLDLIEPLTAASGIAVAASGTWHDTTPNAADTLQARIDKIISDLAGETTGTAAAGGGAMIGHFALPDWDNGGGTPRTRPAQSVVATLITIQQDLEATSNGDDGALRIGSEARTGTSVNLAQGTVAEQLQEVINAIGGLTTANTWSGDNTFTSAGSIIQQGLLERSGADGRTQYRFDDIDVSSANQSVATSDGDNFEIIGNPAATRKVFLRDTVPVDLKDGEVLRFRKNTSTAQQVLFMDEADTTILAQTPADATKQFCNFIWDVTASAWKAVGWSSGITNIA